MSYDPKSVTVPKSVKCLAASYPNKAARRGFIKSYVKVLEDEARSRGSRSKKGSS
jgi:hypothetical protein